MEKQKIVFVGQTPSKFTGNGNMLQTCIDQVDRNRYDVFALIYGEPTIDGLRNPFQDPYNPGCPCYYLQKEGNDWGNHQLLDFISMYQIDQLIFVGIDIWRYSTILGKIRKIASSNKFLWKVLTPYDMAKVREDWLTWFELPDQVYIYSEFGHNLLKDELPNCHYYRPVPRYLEWLKPATAEEKRNVRKSLFADATDETVIIGFIGNNQLRKNILRMMKGVSEVHKHDKDMIFYMHMDRVNGMFDVEMLASDLGFPKKMVRHNGGSRRLFPEELISVCKAFDLFILPSLQEGLSWTVIEMALLGIPCAISRSTSHLDYMHCETIKQLSIGMSDTAELPLPTSRGVSYVPVEAPGPKDVFTAIAKYFLIRREQPAGLADMSEDMIQFGKKWVNGCSDISIILENNNTTASNSFKSEIGEVL